MTIWFVNCGFLMPFKKSLISIITFSSLIGSQTFLPSEKAFAAKINCDSPVHRGKHKDCVEKDGSPKRKEILDKKTGLMVVEVESDYVMDKSQGGVKKLFMNKLLN